VKVHLDYLGIGVQKAKKQVIYERILMIEGLLDEFNSW